MKMNNKKYSQPEAELSESFIPIAFFLTGFIAIITQTILFRELLVVALGNEIILGISLATWLMGIFFGALLGGWICPKTKPIVKVFIISLILMILIIPVAITLIRDLYHLSQTVAGTYIDFFELFIFSAFIILPIGFFIGFTFPLASKLKKGGGNLTEKNITLYAHVYIFEALGFLTGGLLASFYLVENFNSYFIMALAVLPLLFFLGLNALKLKYKYLFPLIFCLIGLDIFFLSPYGNSVLNQKTIQNRWHSISGSKLVQSIDSKFQNIAVGQNYEQFNIYCNGQFSMVFPEKNDQTILAAHLISQHPDPRNILIIGEAVSGLAQHLLKFNLRKITSIEIDAKLINTIKNYLSDSEKKLLSDRRISVKIKDGKKWIKGRVKTQGKEDLFDIIYLNMAEPSTLFLNRYYTREFFQNLSLILNKNGVLGLKVTSSENYARGFVSDYTVSVYNTIKRVFPHIIIAPGEKNFFFASRDTTTVSDSPVILASRYESTGVSPRRLGLIFKSIYPLEKTSFIKTALESNKNKILNTDEKPISLFYYNKIQGWISNKKTEKFFDFFEAQNFQKIAIFITMLFFLRLIYVFIKSLIQKVRQKKRDYGYRLHIIFAILNAGFFGLSLELFIIYSFQNIYGYIYQLIGFIIALFMAGLPIGALFSTKILRSEKTTRKKQLVILLFIQILMIIISLAFPLLLKLFAEFYTISNILFFILTILIGIIIGTVFPLGLSLHFSRTGNMGRTAGIINAADHLGAAFGAFFSGAILLPILGTDSCCQLLAVLSFFTALLLFLNLLQVKRFPHSEF